MAGRNACLLNCLKCTSATESIHVSDLVSGFSARRRFGTQVVTSRAALQATISPSLRRCFSSSHPVQILLLITFMSTTSHIHQKLTALSVSHRLSQSVRASSWLRVSHCTPGAVTDAANDQQFTVTVPRPAFRSASDWPARDVWNRWSIYQWLPILRRECPARTDYTTHTWIIVEAMALTRLRMTDTPASLAV